MSTRLLEKAGLSTHPRWARFFRSRLTAAALVAAGLAAPVSAASNIVFTGGDITHSPDPVVAGSTTNVVYSISVTNSGDVSDTNVKVEINLASSNLTYQSGSFTGGISCSGGPLSNVTVNCNLGTIGAGNSKTGTMTFRVQADAPDATLASTFETYADSDTTHATVVENLNVDVEADVTVDKQAPSPTNEAVPGTNVAWTVVVHNAGPSDATNVVLTDTLPSGFGAAVFSGGGGGCGGATCSLGTIAPGVGNDKTVTVTSAVPDDYHLTHGYANVTNSASVATDTPDAGASDYSDSVSTPLKPKMDLSISITNGVSSVAAGGTVSYTVTVSKTGPSQASGVLISQTNAALLSVFSQVVDPNEGTFTLSPVNPNWFGLDLSGSDSASLTLSGWLNPGVTGTTFAPVITVAPENAGITDTNALNNSATDSDSITRSADLKVVKSNSLDGIVPGQVVPYTITVTNEGPSDVVGAVVADTFDASRVSTALWSCTEAREVTLFGSLADGVGGVDGLDSAAALVVSPDGNQVYVASPGTDNSVARFDRTGATGALVYNSRVTDTAGLGLGGARALALSPEGDQLYVAGFTDNALQVLTRDTGTGALTPLEVHVNGVSGVTLMSGPRGVAVAPDGRHVYVAAATDGRIVTFSRNLSTGALTYVDALPSLAGLAGVRAVAVSPDGRAVIAAGFSANTLVHFTRNPTTGALSGAVSFVDSPATDGLGGVSAVAWGPRGDSFYAVGTNDNAVVAFSRDLTTGVPTYLRREVNATEMIGPTGVAVTPDGQTVFVTAATSGRVVAFNRILPPPVTTDIYKLEFLAATADSSVSGLAITPAGEQVYTVASADDRLSLYHETRGSDCVVPGPSTLTFSQNVTLPAQSTVTYVALATVSGSATGTLVNTATITAPGGVTDAADPHPVGVCTGDADNNACTDTDLIGLEADLTVTKVASPSVATPGGVLNYTITVSNAGPANVTGVSFSDLDLDSGSDEFDSVSWTCAPSPNSACGSPQNGTGNIQHNGDVAIGAGGSVTYTVQTTLSPAAAGTACNLPLTGNCIHNTATATLPVTHVDPTPADLTAAAQTQVGRLADLAIVKTVTTPPALIDAGNELDYSIVVSNCGPSDVTGAVVQDNFPADLTGVSWTCIAVNGSCPANGSGNLNAAVDLDGGDPSDCSGAGVATFTIDSQVVASPAANVLNNIAKVLVPSGVADPTSGNNTSSVLVALQAVAELAIVKTDGGANTAVPGSEITYSITVTNYGPDDASQLVVNDLFPPELRDISWTCSSEAPAKGTLSWLEEQRQGQEAEVGQVQGLTDVQDVAVAPDGDSRFVYATGTAVSFIAPPDFAPAGAISTFLRDPDGGALTYLGNLRDGQTQGSSTIDGLDGAAGIGLSPDGDNLYVVGTNDAKVATFTRNKVNGQLTFFESLAQGFGGVVDGLTGASQIAVSPDGAHAYVTSPALGSIAVFERDTNSSGRLIFVEVQKMGTIPGLAGATGLALSNDGEHVYVAGATGGTVVVFARETDDQSAAYGKLTFLQTLTDNGTGGNFLAGATDVVVSPNDDFVYALSPVEDAVSIFTRDQGGPNFGELTFVSELHEGPVSGLDGARAGAISADGQHLYVADSDGGAVGVFQRNKATGGLKFVEVRRDGVSGDCVQPPTCLANALAGSNAVALDAAGENLYVAATGDSALGVFRRAGAPPAFAFGGGLPDADPPAPVVNNQNGVVGLDAVSDLAIQDQHLYAVSFEDASVVAFSRDADDGELNFLQRIENGVGADGLEGASGVAVYDQSVYVVSQSVESADNTLVTFIRDTGTGLLTFQSLHRNGTNGVSGLFGASDVVVSGDGKNVYVAGRTPGSIAVFARNTINGTLTFVQSKLANQGGVVGITGAAGLALSSDNLHLYVAASIDDGVAVFERDPANGTLSEIQVISGLPELDRAWGIAASREFLGSRNVYVTGHTAGSLVAFARNLDDTSEDFGKLTLLETFTDGEGGVDGIAGGHAVVASPDGKQVYVAGESDDALAVFAREESTGSLIFVEARFDGEGGVDGLDQAYAVVVSANNLQAYVAGFGEDSIALFTRTSGSRCTGAGAGSLVDTGVEIAAGGEVVYTVTATIDPGAAGVTGDPRYLVNEAHVVVPPSITQPGPSAHPANVCTDNAAAPAILDNDGCRDINLLTPQSDLELDKSDHETLAVPGEEISYEITITNDGPSNVVGATVSDPLTGVFPAGASWTCVAAPSGVLSFVDSAFDGVDGAEGLAGVSGVAISPDNLHVYAVSRGEDALEVFALDPTTGELTEVEVHRDGQGGVEGLDGASAVVVSPDGLNVYVAGQVDDAVAVFTRDDNTGALTFLEVQQAPGVSGIDGPVALALDAAGESLYVAAANSNAITVFDRNTVSGALTFLEMQQDGADSVTGLAGASSVVVSPDGAHLYATGENSNAVVVFSRDVNGALTFVQAKEDGLGGTEGLEGARAVAISPDGANVYVGGAGESAIAVFTRAAGLGTLTFAQVVRDGVGGFDGLAGVGALAVTDDSGLGFHLYAAGGAENALAAMRRDAGDAGRLAFVSVERDGFSGVDGLGGAAALAISPDGRWVIAAGTVDDGLAVFSRPTDSSCSGGSDFTLPGVDLTDVVNIAAGSEIVYIVTGVLDSSLCNSYPCAIQLQNTATVTSPVGNTDTDPADNADTDTDNLSPRGDLAITKTDHVAVIQGLDGAAAAAISPDGANLYAVGSIGDGVVAFARDAGDGSLTFLESERDSVNGVDGLNGAAAVAVSPDGAHVYVAGSADNAVVTFVREDDGRLTYIQKLQNGFGGVTGLLGPDGLALSGDGRFLYVAAANSSTVAIFARDEDSLSATYGQLAFVGEMRDGVGGVDGLGLARGLALSPDDEHLYVVGQSDSALAVFSRDGSSGLLTFLEVERDGVSGVSGIAGAAGVSISPDGEDVYVTGSTANAVAQFARVSAIGDADFGKVSWVAASVDGAGGVDGIQGAAGIVVVPDAPGADPGGEHVYVSGRGEDAVAAFARDAITGALTFVSAARQGQGGYDGLDEPAGLAMPLDGGQVYAAGGGSNAIVTSSRDWDGGTLTGTGALAFLESDSDGDGTAAPGQTLTYEIVVTNAGPSLVHNAIVTDIFPGELEDVSWECFVLSPGPAPGAACLGGALGDGDLVRPVRLPPGGAVRYVATGTIKPGVTGAIINTATVAEPIGWIDLDPSNNSATDGDTVLAREADLLVTKIACSDPLDCAATEVTELVPGTPVHYEIRVENLGPSDVEGASVDDVLPEVLSNAAWSCVASPDPGLLSALAGQAAIHDGDDFTDVPQACGPTLTVANGLDGARAVEVTADGLNVYVAGGVDHAIASFRRDLRNGELEFIGVLVDGQPRYSPACAVIGTVDGLRGASGVVSSADGVNVYVSAELDDAISVFSREAGTGALKFQQFLRDGVGGVNGLGNARGVAISPDGKHVYTAARSDNGVGIFTRAPGSGTLTYSSIRVDGAPQPPLTIDGLAGAVAVAISPDGATVYVAGEIDDAIAVFSRNAGSGALTFLEAEKNGFGGVTGLDGARAVAVSGDGLNVYAAGAVSNAVAVFARDPADGKLTFVEAETGAIGLGEASGVRISADGENVYVTGKGDNAVAVFERDPLTGELDPRPSAVDGVAGVDGLSGALGLAISPDDEQVYAAGDGEDAVSLLARHAGSRCTAAGFGNLHDVVDVTAGGAVVYSLTADLSPSASGSLENVATVSSPDDVTDPDPANDEAANVALLTPAVALAVSKTDFQTTAVPGLPVTYTIEVTNGGPSDLVGCEVEDLFPGIFGDASWSCVATDALEFVEAEINGAGGVANLDAPYNLAIAPDPDGLFGPLEGGQHVYVASRGGQSIDLFSRDLGTGELAFVASYIDGVDGFDGFGGAGGLAISPDGANVYVTGKTDDAIAVLARDLVTGALSPVAVVHDTDPGVDGLDGANVVTVSHDGRYVYVGSEDDDALVIFERATDTGALTIRARLKDGFGGLELGTLNRPVALVATADGAHLLVAAADGNRISVFQRDPATGLLTFVQSLIDGDGGVDGLGLVQSIAVSASGQFVYAAGLADDAIAVFSRDAGSGELTYVGVAKDGVGGVEGLDGVRALATSPDGLFLFAASYNDDAVAVFRREPLTGELLPLQVATNGVAGVLGLDGARALAVDPTGRDLLVVGEHADAVAVLSRVGQGHCGTVEGDGDLQAIVDLAAGATATFTVTGTVDAAATGQLINTVEVTMPPGTNNGGDASATDTDDLTPVAGLSITKSDGVTSVSPGSSTIYVITVANAGPSAAPASSVADTLPVAILSATWTCVGSGGGVCTASGSGSVAESVDLPVGGSVAFTLAATVDGAATGTLSNTATVTPAAGVSDPVPGDNSSTDNDTLAAEGDLSLVMTADQSVVQSGEPIVFTLTLSNLGPAMASGITLIDLLPGGVSVTNVTAPGWSCISGVGSITCTLASLDASSSANPVVIEVDSSTTPGSYANAATVTSASADPAAGNNTAAWPFTVVVLEPPSVVRFDSVPDSGDSVLELMETATVPITQVLVEFNEPLFDPAGDSDGSDVTNPANYQLVEIGANGSFTTPACQPLVGDDVGVAIAGVSFDAGTSTATVSVGDGSGLTDGLYRFVVCTSPGVRDLDGNALDGNGDFVPGDDAIQFFRVQIKNLVLRPHADFASDLDDWTGVGGLASDYGVDAAVDVTSFPLSGSYRLQNLSGDSALSLVQCVAVPVGSESLVVSGRARISGAAATTAAGGVAEAIDGPCLAPNAILGTWETGVVTGPTGGSFGLFTGIVAGYPPAATSLRVTLSAADTPGQSIDVRLDELSVFVALFADGFESSDTSRWDGTVP